MSVLILAGSLLALACGHEVSSPPVVRAAAPAPAVTPPTTTTRAALVERPAGERCVEVDSELGGEHVTLEGRVFVDDTFEHPARGKTHPYILLLDAPRCATGTDEPRVSELHLTSSEDIPLKALVGAHVRVSGAPFTAHTAWHARPVVLMVTTAATVRR